MLSWVIAAWLEEGAGVIQSPTTHGGLSGTVLISQQDSLGGQVRRGQLSLATQSWAVPPAAKAVLLPNGASSGQQESSRNAPEETGWVPRGTGMNSVSFWILVVRWLRVESWSGFGSQRTFLLMPLGVLVTAVLCSMLCVFRRLSGGAAGPLAS